MKRTGPVLLVVCWVALLPWAPCAGQGPAGEKATLEGTVTDRVTGAGVRRVRVTVIPVQVLDSSPANLIDVTTDVGGRFAVRDLAPGRYRVMAFRPNYPRSWREQGRIGEIEVSLGPGEEKRDISFAFTPGATLGGRVLDEFGEPLPRCSVQLLDFLHHLGRKILEPVQGNSTNDRGEYRISHVSPGRYYLMASCSNLMLPSARPLAPPETELEPDVAEAYGALLYPGVEDLSGAARLSLAPGVELGGLDFHFRRVRVVTVRGTAVFPSGGTPPEAVNLQLIPDDPLARITGQRDTRSDPKTGKFVITGVRPGTWKLMGSDTDSPAAWLARVELTVGTAPVRDVKLELQPALNLAGTLELEGERGAEQGKMQIYFSALDDAQPSSPPPATVGENGGFSIQGVFPGTWIVNVMPLPPNSYVKSIRLGDQESAGQVLVVPPAAAGPLRIVLSANGSEISGVVEGAPAGSHPSVIVVANPEGDLSRNRHLQRVARVSGGGSFLLRGLAPGEYRLHALETQDWTVPQNDDLLRALEARSQRISVHEGQKSSVQLALIPAAAIEAAQSQAQ